MVQIGLEHKAGEIVLRVTDDGPGFDVTQLPEILSSERRGRRSVGLQNIFDRMQALYGASYQPLIQSQPGQGTRVEIRVPIKE